MIVFNFPRNGRLEEAGKNRSLRHVTLKGDLSLVYRNQSLVPSHFITTLQSQDSSFKLKDYASLSSGTISMPLQTKSN